MKITSILLATLLSVSTGALAHIEHDDTPPQTIKLKAKKNANGIIVYVTDKGVKVPTAGASGKLVWLNGAAKGETVLEPAGDNGMQAKYAKPPAGRKMQVSITFADKTVFTSDVTVK